MNTLKSSRFIFLALTFLLLHNRSMSQNPNLQRPKLVVGIIIDQMRYDYLYRFYSKYSNGGFKKLMNGGFNCRNTNYNYAPTYTGPGHASVYSGTTPSQHGIIGNEWYVRQTGKTIYVTDDSTVSTVGSSNSAVGKMSPANMLATTVTDELRLSTNKKSKVIGIALKDRAAILPAGHLANAAYWFDSKTGNFVSSTFYMNDLPQWMKNYNDKHLTQKYLSQKWNTLLPINQYTESSADDNPYEGKYPGENKPVFPHDLSKMWKPNDFDIIRSTPFGNTLTKDAAISAIEGEKLGKGTATDFIAISFSSTDYIGHKMGPQSVEVEDTYLRLDRDLAELLSYLEKNYGKDGFLLFLTADHGAAYVPAQLKDDHIPAGYFLRARMLDSLKTFLNNSYGSGNWITSYINQQVYLDHDLIYQKNISLKEIREKTAEYILKFEGVANTYTASQLNASTFKELPESYLQNGFNEQRSGDVSVLLRPGWIEFYGGTTGTTHGTPYSYDTHVPLLWYGWHIRSGSSAAPVTITDIAPTLADLLRISQPDEATGKPISDLLTK
jgi:predicted AlkP superfamily pyrophosphatase or phosphodiesterase